MSIETLQFMQDEIRRLIGKAVCRLNTQGANISREAIISTLEDLINETDDTKKQREIQEAINMFITTNGKFN
ncbi:hypothetical protein [Pragia fontium]|uniref:Uncharacterized protein n=2 Tax=Pragia fontium TaxID=82985 RepID=A0AAJ4W9B8_9GAMM|nr:hypothetical protein [Pragia fontium]AKJ42012.1 hypothetical protein QQ39_07890 [Pragia fontium]SFC45406.1 hypothetical protein SAMN02745723_102396 [Pragia fontium DSM 5563 = ATCC 49100]SUB82244.1 Uncharacterised protein [Pragia fontium]VEJ55021.1 Uncharacterised protein [Pragia fontium]